MNCNDPEPSLKDLDDRNAILFLKKERNMSLKSRQQWIQAAFDLKRGDDTLFNHLVSSELCQKCIDKYSIN